VSERPRRRRRGPWDLPPGPDDWTVADGDEPTLTRVEGPTLLSGELARVARRPGWGERLGGVRVWSVWEDIVGAELAEHCEPIRLAGRVLVVRAESAAWATQLRYLTSQLIARAESALGPGSVREVRVTVGSLEGREAGPGGERRAAPPPPVGHHGRTDLSMSPRPGGPRSDGPGATDGPDDASDASVGDGAASSPEDQR
jgi:hypothetical protein